MHFIIYFELNMKIYPTLFKLRLRGQKGRDRRVAQGCDQFEKYRTDIGDNKVSIV